IADDLRDMREKAARLLLGQFDVVGQVENGAQAVVAAELLKPGLVVLDISMPVLNGIQAADRLRTSGCRGRVVFLSVYEDPDYMEAAFAVGAFAYVLKSRMATDLIPALNEALRGCADTEPTSSLSAARR